jgi:D-sedoheptulose 7-phosphate isomerase
MIKLVAFDIDGVFTDGSVYIDSNGKESKKVNYIDMDAYFEIQSKYKTAIITAASESPLVKWFMKKYYPNYFYAACKNKLYILQDILEEEKINPDEVCYIGDSKHDFECLKYVGVSVCPQNAIKSVKDICKYILPTYGGNGAIDSLKELLNQLNV